VTAAEAEKDAERGGGTLGRGEAGGDAAGEPGRKARKLGDSAGRGEIMLALAVDRCRRKILRGGLEFGSLQAPPPPALLFGSPLASLSAWVWRPLVNDFCGLPVLAAVLVDFVGNRDRGRGISTLAVRTVNCSGSTRS